MAEFLIRVATPARDDLTQAQIDALSEEDRRMFYLRTKAGDIVCVRPDGFVWGKMEALPEYIVIKVPAISYDTAKEYEDFLYAADGETILRKRKWAVPKLYISQLAANGVSPVTITKNVFNNQIYAKVVT